MKHLIKIILTTGFFILFLIPTNTSAVRSLSFGMSGNDVISLQNALIARGYLPVGKNTGYFGSQTETAVKKFQCESKIICSGTKTTGYGVYGPKTQLALNNANHPLEFSGWIPYWRSASGTQDVLPHLSQLKSIMPFVYTVKTDGTLNDAGKMDEEPWVSFMAAAKKAKVRVVPTVMWGDSDAIHKILSNQKTRIALEDEIANLVKKNNFDGIDIDFEAKKHETVNYFSTFLKGLYQRMGNKWVYCTVEARMPLDHRYLPGAKIPPDATDYANDYSAMNKYCDRFEIMAYDQGTIDLKLNAIRSAPYAPIADPDWVEGLISMAIKGGVARNKIILGVPTYGYEYKVTPIADGGYKYQVLWPFNLKYATDIASKLGINPTRNSAGEIGFSYDAKLLEAAPTGLDSTQTQQHTATTTISQNSNSLVNLTQPFNYVSWSDAKAIADKVALARKFGLRGIAVFKFDGGEDQAIWDVLK